MLGPTVQTSRRRTRSGLTLRAEQRRAASEAPEGGRDTFDANRPLPRRTGNRSIAAAPWQSKGVMQLVNRARDRRGDAGGEAEVEPMLIEGRRGTSLRAVGEAADHKVAGDALSQLMQMKADRGFGRASDLEVLLPPPSDMAPNRGGDTGRIRGGRSGVRGGGGGTTAREFEDVQLGRSGRGSSQQEEYAFGAVYEHVDSFGRPRVVASVGGQQPEAKFLEDGRRDGRVARLLTQDCGSSRVVWAGVGKASAGIGDGEIGVMRQAIVDARSRRLNIEKLGGVKPYSAHGY